MAAATSILHRANEAVAKEQRLAAVTELQHRVEDWKGHQIDHFGDLMLFGTFTVLKGEGAKEVEREVREIFFSLSPKCRKQIRRTLYPDWSPSPLCTPKKSPHCLEWKADAMVSEDLDLQEYAEPNLHTVGRLDPNPHTKAFPDRTSTNSQARMVPCPKRFVSGLEGVPEETHDEHSEVGPRDGPRKTTSNDHQGPQLQSRPRSPPKTHCMPSLRLVFLLFPCKVPVLAL